MWVGDFFPEEEAVTGHGVRRVKVRLGKFTRDAHSRKGGEREWNFVLFQVLASEPPPIDIQDDVRV